MSDNPRLYQIALTMINGIGISHTRELLNYYGDAESIFREKKSVLARLPGVGRTLAQGISDPAILVRAEKEYEFARKNEIRIFCLQDNDYPNRLRNCCDAPYIFYFKGHADLDAKHIISIVGTRMATDYGREMTNGLLDDLAQHYPQLLVVSGLAYGIDITAHRAALANGLPTVAVLGHGLDRIYPYVHRQTAAEMIREGGLLTEFISGIEPDRYNFVQRNRIIAGLADATIVIESAAKGGSLITAEVALSYSRNLCAFPGRVTDAHSKGCNALIRANKAAMITSADDFIQEMGWNTADTSAHSAQPIQTVIDFGDDAEFNQIYELLKTNGEMHVNQLSVALDLPVSHLANKLFDMELNGLIKNLPGNIYRIN